MANDDLMIEVSENSTIAVSDGVREGIKEWAKEPVKAWFKVGGFPNLHDCVWILVGRNVRAIDW